MEKWIIGVIVSVACVCGVFVYMKWAPQESADVLRQPPAVEQGGDTEHQPHGRDDPVPTTPTNVVEEDSALDSVEDTGSASTDQISEDHPSQVDTDTVQETDQTGQTDAVPQTEERNEHQSAEDLSKKETIRIEDMDPDELTDMMHVGLLRRFGDIPEVHTFTALRRKKLKNQPLTLDEHIEYTRAQLHLWPDPRTAETLQIFLEEKASQHENREVNR